MSIINKWSERNWYAIIGVVSITLIAIVSLLIFKARYHTEYDALNTGIYILPKMNAFINGTVTLLILAGFYFIKFKRNRKLHRASMIIAFVLSCLFLVSYLTYHYSAPEIKFGDLDHNGIVDDLEKTEAGSLRYVYYLILASHIILSSIIIPMILITFYRIIKNDIKGHRKIAKWTFPLWLYVSITGVVVYLLISQYYPIHS